jgi:tRNA-specific 2-thiouridylase
MEELKHIKAVGLVSGGLDSVLAARMILDQGIEVVGLHLITPFSSRSSLQAGEESIVQKQASQIGFQYYPLYLGEEYVDLIKNPRWGYGSCMNPCIDCHIFFLQKAAEIMKEEKAQFVFTGEVLEQRPMSQKRTMLRMIEKRSGLEGYLLRPLTALRLDPTIPEKMGLVDRTLLLGLAGRSRKKQFELAALFSIDHFQTPAGGCLLTDPGFSARLNDLFGHGISDINSIESLKLGRHFRLAPSSKLIVGRNESDNRILANLVREGDILLEMEGGSSPLSILRGDIEDDMLDIAAAVTKRYSKGRNDPGGAVLVRRCDSGEITSIIPAAVSEHVIESLRIV